MSLNDRATAVCRPNAKLVAEIFCYQYSIINNSAENNISQRNLIIALEIYRGLDVQNFIFIFSDLTFLWYDV